MSLTITKNRTINAASRAASSNSLATHTRSIKYGRSNTFANAIANFAVAYADQTGRDYETLVKAIKAGRIAAETGI